MRKNTRDSYGSVSKTFHWSISIAVFTMIAIGFIMGTIKNEATADQFYIFHKSLGLTILLFMIFRVIWRLINPTPNLNHIPAWQRLASHTSHFLLYVLLFALPISGWIMSTASGNVPHYFWTFYLPMPGIPHSKSLTDQAVLMHEIFAWTIIVLLCIHIAAALKHHFIDKDHILRRMLPGKNKTISNH